MKGQKEQWGKKREEYDVWYEVWSKIEKVLDQWEQSCWKTTAGLIATTAEWSLIKVEWE